MFMIEIIKPGKVIHSRSNWDEKILKNKNKTKPFNVH